MPLLPLLMTPPVVLAEASDVPADALAVALLLSTSFIPPVSLRWLLPSSHTQWVAFHLRHGSLPWPFSWRLLAVVGAAP